MPESATFWPRQAAAAVSLTFDDGLSSQLDRAIPGLDNAGLKGTFYLNPGPGRPHWLEQVPRWQAAAESGHEMGNHTSRHPCSCNYGLDDRFCLEKLSLDDMASTILDGALHRRSRLRADQPDRLNSPSANVHPRAPSCPNPGA